MKKQLKKAEKPAIRSSIGRYLAELDDNNKPEAHKQEAAVQKETSGSNKKPVKKRK